MPYMDKTKPSTTSQRIDYGKRLEDWFASLRKEDEQPNAEQWQCLSRIRRRLLDEIELENENPVRRRIRRAVGVALNPMASA